MLEDLEQFKKPVQVVVTKLDKLRNNADLIKVITETSNYIMRHKNVSPEIHLISSH